jgi:hypothetical protein
VLDPIVIFPCSLETAMGKNDEYDCVVPFGGLPGVPNAQLRMNPDAASDIFSVAAAESSTASPARSTHTLNVCQSPQQLILVVGCRWFPSRRCKSRPSSLGTRVGIRHQRNHQRGSPRPRRLWPHYLPKPFRGAVLGYVATPCVFAGLRLV